MIVSGVRQGTRRLTIAKSGNTWSATEAWHTPDVAMYMSSPVLVRGTLFGHSSKRKGQFVALNADTGKILWATEGRNATSASVVAAGSHLVFLTTESQMIVTRSIRPRTTRSGATPWHRARSTRSRSSCATG